ncbi:hypothetical protein EDB85DRAFT_1886727 [Lactarius pseudohatsudake]|nr:hypothetical protein EDB85DRAFT_1886727 [Lactarius pseudohatsudake]
MWTGHHTSINISTNFMSATVPPPTEVHLFMLYEDYVMLYWSYEVQYKPTGDSTPHLRTPLAWCHATARAVGNAQGIGQHAIAQAHPAGVPSPKTSLPPELGADPNDNHLKATNYKNIRTKSSVVTQPHAIVGVTSLMCGVEKLSVLRCMQQHEWDFQGHEGLASEGGVVMSVPVLSSCPQMSLFNLCMRHFLEMGLQITVSWGTQACPSGDFGSSTQRLGTIISMDNIKPNRASVHTCARALIPEHFIVMMKGEAAVVPVPKARPGPFDSKAAEARNQHPLYKPFRPHNCRAYSSRIALFSEILV